MTIIPAAIGPYETHRKTGNLLFTSGQLPINPATGEFDSDNISEQTKQSLLNVEAILKSQGLTISKIIKTTVYLANIADFNEMNEVYATFFNEPYPARSAFEVANLPKGAKVEIEVIAEF